MAVDVRILDHASDLARTARARPERRLVRVIVASDLVALGIAAAAAAVLGRPAAATLAWAAVSIGATLVLLTFYGVYERDRRQIAVSTLDEMPDFLHALVLLGFGEIVVGAALHLDVVELTRAIAAFAGLAMIALPLGRGALRHAVVPMLNTPQNAVVIGAGRVGQLVAEKIRKHPEYNVRIVGFLDDAPHPLGGTLDDLPILGAERDLVAVLRRHRVSRVILAFSKHPHDRVLEVLREAGLRDVHLSIIPRYFEIIGSSAGVTDIDGIPAIDLPAARLSRLSACTKRTFDLVLTVPTAVLLAPLAIAISIAIKLDSEGPVLFRQPRRGRREHVFEIFKFRTMVDGAERMRDGLLAENECVGGPLFKLQADPRVTRVGALLRKLSLDELPQLLNVLRGEMSLVGPRPFVVYEDDQIHGWARRRLDLTPGITGLWQVLGRNSVPFEEMVKLDCLYVHNWSLWWDMKLLLRTVPVVVRRRGY